MHEIDKKCQKCKNNRTAICNRCDMYYDEFDPIEDMVCAKCLKKIQNSHYTHRIIFQELISEDNELKSSKSFNLCFECMQEVQEFIFED